MGGDTRTSDGWGMEENLARAGFCMAHDIPGRMRVKGGILAGGPYDPAFLEGYLLAVEGVSDVRANPRAGSIVVEYEATRDVRERILAAIVTLPPEVSGEDRISDAGPPVEPEGILPPVLLLVSLFFLPMRIKAVVSWLFAAPLMARGVETLVTKGLKVVVLDATAVTFALLRRDYFSAAAIQLLLRVGEIIESTTTNQSDRLIRRLLIPRAENAWVLKGGVEAMVPASSLAPGDLVVCATGNRIPVDGLVEEGVALVNQASMTGEAVPVRKERGSRVLSGTVVEEGRIVIRAETAGAETAAARISRHIRSALQAMSPAQRRSEGLADSLVPLTFGLGAAIAVLSRDLRKAASVLSVDYSCAIRISTPVAVKSAMYEAGSRGVLIKGGQALESFSEVDTVVFDKTGTITSGAFEVTDVVSLDPSMSSDVILALAASAEEHYRHPISDAIVSEARRGTAAFFEHTEVDYVVAHGVATYVEGKRLLVGSEHFLREDEGIAFGPCGSLAQDPSKTFVYVAYDERLAGFIGLRDAVRPEAGEVMRGLRDLGVKRIVMLSGDSRERAVAVARSVGMDEAVGDLLPGQKAEVIARLQAEGGKVAFVGDGVNDAPALVAADVGVSMARGSELARATAEIVLLEEGLRGLTVARRVSNEAVSVIRGNFSAAIGVNSAILLAASLGFLSPLASAVLHNATTVGIILHSLSGVSSGLLPAGLGEVFRS